MFCPNRNPVVFIHREFQLQFTVPAIQCNSDKSSQSHKLNCFEGGSATESDVFLTCSP